MTAARVHEVVPLRIAPAPARQVQRCGGISCSPGACPHTDDPEDAVVHRSAVGSAPASGGGVPPSVHRTLATAGTALDASTRQTMEHRLGHNFGAVRIHTDATAAASAEAIHATAYTYGHHVVMGVGRYQPHTTTGQTLLAHELTHVVQQGGSFPGPPTSVSDPHDANEREAERNAQHALGAPRARSTQGALLRQAENDPAPSSDEDELPEAGSIALANVLRRIAGNAETYRQMYNRGAAQIEATIKAMRANGVPETTIAQRAAGLRHQLAEEVRGASGRLAKAAAEAFDSVRGNVGRPTYEVLRAAGKTDADIIASAARTNTFVNRLPTGVRWTGRALWFVAAGLALYEIASAPEEQQAKVAAEQVGGLAGAAGGTALTEGLCLVLGVATEGIVLVICGLLGGLVGFEAGRQSPGLLEQAVGAQADCLKICESQPWYLKGFCMSGCTPAPF